MELFEFIPNFHPIFVHFTVALLSISVGCFFIGITALEGRSVKAFITVAHWNLWLGAGITVITIGTGLYEYYTVAHDDPSHQAMTNHRNWAIAAAIVFWILALWSARDYWQKRELGKSFVTILALATVLLMITGWKGGELVFRYGLGVLSLPQASGEGHGHSKPHATDDDPGEPHTSNPETSRENQNELHDSVSKTSEETQGHPHDADSKH
jgi:uncharacterized membrane protein